MTATFTCPHGHSWSAAFPESPGGDEPHCPVCGAAVRDAGTTLVKDPADTKRPVAGPATAYQILAPLGRGGMAAVYKARQVGLNRIVALKMILGGEHASPEERIRFQLEAEAVARLQHPNIVAVHDVGTHDGFPYLALEYVEGGTLQQKLAAGRLAPRDAALLLGQLAAAVHYAHQRGIIHRDLKPGNILLAADGTPKIADFGLAKRLDGGADSTQSGRLLGTPAYMAPEQAQGDQRQVGPAADVYALGAILYHLLTGRPPFLAASPLETLDQARHQEPAAPRSLNPQVPRDLETVCLKCLQKDPARRYATAQELADDLDRYLQGEPLHARPVSAAERCVKWVRRRPAWAALTVVSALLVLGAFAWVVQRWRDAETQHRAEAQRRRQEKLMEAANFIHFMDVLREMYASEILDRVKGHGVQATADYKSHKGAIPIWATFVHELSDRLDRRGHGQYTRLYSDHPWRSGGGPHDDFEREALAQLRRHPDRPYYRFEEYRGRMSLRYAAADVMLKACVDCHNHQPASPKRDWKVGDVRGVLEVILPLQ